LSYQGLPILADDPEQAKVAINSSGFGLITRLVEPACSLSISISFFLWLKRFVSTQRMLLMLIPALTYSLSSGSKGALAIFLICYASVSTFLTSKDLYFRPNLRGSFRVVSFFLLTLFAYAFLVLIRRGVSESSPFEFALNTFGVRLLAYGDGAYYYFFNDLSTYIKHDYFDFFWGYAVAPILGFLRIAEYPMTLGVRIANEMFGMEAGGPNPTFLVEAHVYFGLTVGWIYSFLIGFLFQYLRQSFIMMKYHFNAWSFLWITALYSISCVVPVDMILFASSIFNYALLILLLWFVYSISDIVCSPAS
jgi:hypothetical protein